MRPQLRILVLLIAIAWGFLLFSSFTGFFTAGGSSWEGKTSVTVAAEQPTVTQHIVFGNSKPYDCADGIFVSTQDGAPVEFSTFNEVHNRQGFCTETNVKFNNIIYQVGPQPEKSKSPFSIITGAQTTQGITYEIYYGKISAGEETTQPLVQQPVIERPAGKKPAVAEYGVGGRGGGGTNPQGINTSSCTNITTNGSYTLINDINSTGTCININASDVEFDCDDYNITYATGNDHTYGINVSSSQALTNVTIKNCDIYQTGAFRYWSFGIVLFNTSNSSLQNDSISTKGGYCYGIYVNYSSNSNSITSSNITTTNSDSYGIYLMNSNSTTITSSNITTTSHGIVLYYSNSNNITANKIISYGTGVIFSAASNYNNVTYNNISNTGGSGGAQGITGYCTSCNIIGNNIFLSSDNGGNYGLWLTTMSSSNITYNNITAVGGTIANNYGIFLQSSSSNNNLNNNNITVNGTESWGVRLLSNSNSNSFAYTNIFNPGNNSDAIQLNSSSHNSFASTDVSAGRWSFNSTGGSINNTVTSLNTSMAIASFVGKDFALKNATAPANDPTNYQNISVYVNVTNTSVDYPWLFLNISFNDTDLSNAGVDDSRTLAMAKYSSLSSLWVTNLDLFTTGIYGVEISQKYVYANITNFGSTFAPLSDQFSIAHCRQVNEAGYHKLVGNIFNDTVTCCINITASDVIIDGQNYELSSDDNGATDGVCNFGALTNVTVENMRIKDWGEGIYLSNIEDGSITNITATSNVNVGIVLFGSSNLTTIANNTVYNNSGGISIDGIGVAGNNNTIANNNASFNDQTGIAGAYCNYNNYTNNTVESNSGRGISLSAENNSILDSNAVGLNGQAGIYLAAVASGILTNNNASLNTDYGIRLTASSDNNNMTNNTFNENDYNIFLQGSSNNNNFLNNTVSSSNSYDVYIADANGNTFINQTVASYPTTVSFTSSSYVTVKGVKSPPSDPGSYYNISKYVDATNQSDNSWLFLNISYADSDLGSVDESTLFMARENGSWETNPSVFTDGTYNVNTGENYVYANITDFGSTFAPLGSFGCRNITSEGYSTLAQDLTGVQAGRNVCIDIQVDNVIFDCAGHSLSHDNTAGTIGIYANSRDNVTIENCRVTNYYLGVSLVASNNSLIKNNTATSNDWGIYLNSSSSSNNITNNTASLNGYGIYLNSAGSGNNIKNNTAELNGQGIYLQSSSSNTLTKNAANTNANHGIHIASSNYDNITNNTVGSNTVYGISIDGNSQNNIVFNNTVDNSGSANIYLDLTNAQYNNISTNTITSNAKGIYLYTLGVGTNNAIEYNRISSTSWGIHLYGNSGSAISIHEYIRHNSISNCSHGIYIQNIKDGTFLNNTISTSTDYDIYMYNAQNNTFTNTSIGGSGGITTINYPTTISFNERASGGGNNMTLRGVHSPVPSDPSNYVNISKYVNATSSGAGNWLYLNVSYSDADLGGIDEGTLVMARKNATAWETTTSNFASSSGVNTDANYVYANITGFGSIFAPLGATGGASTSTCMNISLTGYYTLSQDVNNSAAECCINISVSDVTFDGQGYTVGGDNVTGLDGVCAWSSLGTLTNVTVKNVVVTNWTDIGIKFNNVQNGSIENNTAYSNTYNGIYLESSSNISIASNNLTNNYYGLLLKGDANDNNISDNIANNNLYGIFSQGSNTLINNTANNNYYDSNWGDGGYGILLNGAYNNATNNTANNNTYWGLSISGASWNNLTNNTANNNQYGIYMSTTSDNILTDNIAENNVWDFYSEWLNGDNIITNLEIGSTIVSFIPRDIALRNGVSPGADPANYSNISKYVNATNTTSADPWLYLNVSYSDPDISGVTESTLRMAKHNDTGWFTDPDAFTDGTHDVNQGANYVYANITDFGSDFVPLGNISGGGGGGGNGTNGSGNVNISIETTLSITFVDNIVDFGAGFVTSGYAYADVDSNDTTTGTAGNWTSTLEGVRGWPNNTNYMYLENNGNVKANVNISAGSSAATFIGGTGPDQWYAVADNESNSCDGVLQDAYTLLGTSQASVCTSLRSNDTTDALNLMFKLRVPSDAPNSAKSNTITFSAVQA